MRPLFDISNYKKIQKLKFECELCGNIFEPLRRNAIQGIKSNNPSHVIKYCSKNCKLNASITRIDLNCSNCGQIVSRKLSDYKKSKSSRVFCSSSCSASFNNKNKKFGVRRSKLEIWIEEELKKEYNFEIIFNGKETINSELDIYIPSLNLAFELNGIFHYEPIYGEEKLKNVKNNDNRKFQACLEKNIELCIIDVSNSKHFKPERDKKYLDIIKNVIDNKNIFVPL